MEMVSVNLPLQEVFRSRKNLIIADWQRGNAWETKRKQKLLDSIFRGWNLPKFYIAESGRGDGQWFVVDGQQRLSTINSFFTNQLELSWATVSLFDLPSGTYEKLSSTTSANINKFPIQVDEIRNATAADLKIFFYRLQQGMTLTRQERLNAVEGGLADFCRKLTQHEFFQTRVPLANARLKHLDVTTKMVALAIRGFDENLEFEGIRGLFEKHVEFSPASPVAQHLMATLNFLGEAFSYRTSVFGTASAILSYVTLASHLVASGESAGTAKGFAAFLEKFDMELKIAIEAGEASGDPEYLNFYKSARNNRTRGLRTRHEFLVKKLETEDVGLAELVKFTENLPLWLSSLPENENTIVLFGEERVFRTVGKKTSRNIIIPRLPVVSQKKLSFKIISKSETLKQIFQNSDRFLIPEWQRFEVWDLSRKQALIDTVFRGWKLPKLYVAQIDAQPKSVEIVDGQQRLSTLLSFMRDEFPLSALSAKDFGLKPIVFGKLPLSVVDKFYSFKIEYDEIQGATQKELIELYQRLQEGKRLTSSEKLNAKHGGLRDYCIELIDHPFFQKSVSFSNTRHMLFDLSAKMLAVEIGGLFAKLNPASLQNLFEDNAGFTSSSPISGNVAATLNFLVKAFPEKSLALEGRAFTQSVFTLASQLIKAGKSDGQEKAFERFISNFYSAYLRERDLKGYATDPHFIAVNKSIRGHGYDDVQVRHLALLTKMQIMAPALYGLFVNDHGKPQRANTGSTPISAPVVPGLLFLKQGNRSTSAPVF